MNIGPLLRNPFLKLVDELHQGLAQVGYADIRPAHGNVFQFIGKEGARLTAMADKAQMTKQSMSYLVEDLEKMGYVERMPDKSDKRAIIFRLTRKGWAASNKAEAIIANIQKEWTAKLGETEMNRLETLLVKLNKAIE